MSRLKTQLSWLLRGGVATRDALDALTRDLQALQQKVVDVERRMDEIQRRHEELTERQLAGFDRIRDALGDAVDDLAERIAAVHARVEAQERG